MCMHVCAHHYRNSAGQSLQCIHFWGCIIHATMLIVVVVVVVRRFCVESRRSRARDSLAYRGVCSAERGRGREIDGAR